MRIQEKFITKMKTIEGFKMRSLCDMFVITGEGLKQINYNKIISLNASAAFLWERIEGKDFSIETLADLLTGEYEIDRERALKDSEAIAKSWIEAGIVEE